MIPCTDTYKNIYIFKILRNKNSYFHIPYSGPCYKLDLSILSRTGNELVRVYNKSKTTQVEIGMYKKDAL